jgi:aryl-alcohol dehydrogenase-like predicted oxidoreductase
MHAPDAATPIGDTLEALEALVRAGKVLEIGCSNFTAVQLDEAWAVAADRGLRRFVTVQNEYSLLQRDIEHEVLPACARLEMSLVPYFPLASGLLTGKYRRGEDPPSGTRLAVWPKERVDSITGDERFAAVERLGEFARARDLTLPELALSWLASNPLVSTVIAGATSPEQVRQNAAATTAWAMTETERAEVAALVAHS